MKPDFDTILDECIRRIESGEELETCLADYPEHTADLEALLTIAQDMYAISAPQAGCEHPLSTRAQGWGSLVLGSRISAPPHARRRPVPSPFRGRGIRCDRTPPWRCSSRDKSSRRARPPSWRRPSWYLPVSCLRSDHRTACTQTPASCRCRRR